MHLVLVATLLLLAAVWLLLHIILYFTQDAREPRLVGSTLPFLDSLIGMIMLKTDFFEYNWKLFNLPIYTMRLPFSRTYVTHDPHLVQTVQSKSNASTFVPNLLEFGMLFSGLSKSSRGVLRAKFRREGNSFTLGVHKYLLSGVTLGYATKAAVDILSAGVTSTPNTDQKQGLLEYVKHELAMAMTGAIYGHENPYHDPEIESSWNEFVPGITHLLSSPFPSLTARKAMIARRRVIAAFQRYFASNGHTQAFPMISEMYSNNQRLGLDADEAAKMEMATSLAMLSSGANTTFWFLLHILSDSKALEKIRQELHTVSEKGIGTDFPQRRTVYLDQLKSQCPTLLALFNETLRCHSSVINVKEVQHDTTLDGRYLLKKDGIIMIPGRSIHHNTDIWGPHAAKFDYNRFLQHDTKKKLSSTSAFRPFGAGATMCPGRHFSTNVILSFAAMVILQYDIVPEQGAWQVPTNRHADFWNAMPKPDWDIHVRFERRLPKTGIDWKFVWDTAI